MPTCLPRYPVTHAPLVKQRHKRAQKHNRCTCMWIYSYVQVSVPRPRFRDNVPARRFAHLIGSLAGVFFIFVTSRVGRLRGCVVAWTCFDIKSASGPPWQARRCIDGSEAHTLDFLIYDHYILSVPRRNAIAEPLDAHTRYLLSGLGYIRIHTHR